VIRVLQMLETSRNELRFADTIEYAIFFCKTHNTTHLHTTKMRERLAGSLTGVKLIACITDYKGTVSTQSGGHMKQGSI
jgi:hypothetical protein